MHWCFVCFMVLMFSGTFTLTYDNRACTSDYCANAVLAVSAPIAHNARATRAEAAAAPGPHVASVQEILEDAGGVGMPNIGIVSVRHTMPMLMSSWEREGFCIYNSE